MHVKLTDFGTAKSVEGTEGERATFVGTPQYVAPETLDDSITSAASDLWSLGCVIFQMLTGHPPFDGESEYLIFQKILSAKYEFPPDFPETGKDLIQKLLAIDPKERLGVGNYEELKSHPFFEGIRWDELAAMTPPKLRENMDDLGLGEDGEEGSDSLESKWEQFLMETEKILHTGMIVKRRKMTSKKRQLILTDFPRIFYVDPERMVQMGEIPWSEGLWVQVKNDRKFIVHTPNRKYDLESLDDQAMAWANEINGIKTSLKDDD
jgi:3-phosphoinositide dependent protein kinase-1